MMMCEHKRMNLVTNDEHKLTENLNKLSSSSSNIKIWNKQKNDTGSCIRLA